MKRTLSSLLLSLPLLAQISTPGRDRELADVAKSLSTLTYDAQRQVTIQGQVATLVWPEGANGILILETANKDQYAFSTARVPAMAKQGFTRFAVKPGDRLTVTGVLAGGVGKIGPGWIAARADSVDTTSGKRLFDRSKLPEQAK